LGDQSLFLSEEAELLRWFLLPSEAQLHLLGQPLPPATPPFLPKCYPTRQHHLSPRSFKPAAALHSDRSRVAVEKDSVAVSLNSSTIGCGRSECSSVEHPAKASHEVQLLAQVCNGISELGEKTSSSVEPSPHSVPHNSGTCREQPITVANGDVRSSNDCRVAQGAHHDLLEGRPASRHCVSQLQCRRAVGGVHPNEGEVQQCCGPGCGCEQETERREEDDAGHCMKPKVDGAPKFHCPPKRIMKPTIEVWIDA